MAETNLALSLTVQLANGVRIPQIQLGLYQLSGSTLSRTIQNAVTVGYRGFDCAQWYYNETEVGRSLAQVIERDDPRELQREDIWYTTKLSNNSTSYRAVRNSIKKSVQISGLGYVDLFLLHSPLGGRQARIASWKALEDAIDEGEVRMGGLSNFGSRHIEEIMASSPRIPPVVNQIEVHPFNTNMAIRATCEKYNIRVQAYSPLVKGMRMNHELIQSLSQKYNRTPAQILIRWSLQHNLITLPKSSSIERLRENADVADFEISYEDMDSLNGLDEHLVTDWDPTDHA